MHMELREQYKRTFVIFEEFDSGFGVVKDKVPLGYMKMDLKEDSLKLSVFVQNLKKLEGSFYKVILVDLAEPNIRELGSIKINEKGKGEMVLELKGRDIFNIQDYDIIMVAVEGLKGLSIPLAGFLKKKLENPREELRRALEILQKEAMDKIELIDERHEERENVENIGGPEDSIEENVQGSKEEMDIMKDALPKESEEDEDEKREEKASREEKYGQFEEDINYGIKIKEYIKGVVKYLKEVKPFEWELEGYRWWMVDWGMIYGYPGRYLIGLYYDEKGDIKYLVYGIPGRFCLQEQPFGGLTGFSYWHPVKGHLRKFGEKGYWLLHIDAESGNIVYPLKPTPPPVI